MIQNLNVRKWDLFWILGRSPVPVEFVSTELLKLLLKEPSRQNILTKIC